jgi:hypothetical protein
LFIWALQLPKSTDFGIKRRQRETGCLPRLSGNHLLTEIHNEELENEKESSMVLDGDNGCVDIGTGDVRAGSRSGGGQDH